MTGRPPWSFQDALREAREFVESDSVVSMEMGIGTRQAQSVELGERAARENFSFFSTGLSLGKRELLLDGLPHGSRIAVICPKTLTKLWEERAEQKIGGFVRVWGREYAAMNSQKVAREVEGSFDYLLVEEPQGAKSSQRLARIAIKSPRTIVIGFTAGDRMMKRMKAAATVLGVPVAAMPVVLLHGERTANTRANGGTE